MTTTTTIRKSYGNRKLYSFPEDYSLRVVKQKTTNNAPKKTEDVVKLLKYIEDNIIGKNNAFLGPFGRRKVVFCDYAASGRSLQFVEEYIVREVLPCFGSTHSTISITSLQTALFRQEARDIIRNAVNASEDDAVLFTSDGSRGAISKLIQILDFREPPVVFVAPNEDVENVKLWQNIAANVVRIGETKEGFIDLHDLEEQLKAHQNMGHQMIGCFSFASNVTGIFTDDVASTLLLHQYGALAFWDYSIAAPSVLVDMNPVVPGVEENTLNKDAVYFSGHKFIGGVQTPGILIAKKCLFQQISMNHNDSFFETQEHKRYFEANEEGGSAAVVESIRAGLVMQLKETVTVAHIMQRQEKITRQMLQHIRTIPEIILLGNCSSQLKRLPIFSFMVKHPRGIFLHHNFVCAVLNDVFGIQARAGCACTGFYVQDLLKIDQNLADQFENIILEDRRLSSLNLSMNSTLELLKPGFTRISLPYFISESELAFVMEAVKMVATEGWKLLPQYIVDLSTGEWRHYSNAISKDRKWLNSIRYVDGKMTMNERRISGPGIFPQNYSECLQTARNLFNRARKTISRNPFPDQTIHFDSRSEKLRWFMVPKEAQNILIGKSQNVKNTVPFNPIGYLGSRKSEKVKDASSTESPSPLPCTNLTSRHLSLPTIEDALHSPSSVPYVLQENVPNSVFSASSYQHFIQTSAPNFAVGEAVSSTVFSPVTSQPATFHRERCLSLGDPTVSPPPPPALLSPQTRASLGMSGNVRKRNCSYSSQTDLHSLDSDTNTSPSYSLNMLYCGNDSSYLGRGSPAPNAELQAFVSELATSIKSEIREVTKKVENVLENTDSVDIGNVTFCKQDTHGSSSEDGRSDSISANEVAEYLEKVSKEMVNEVKSEIRDVVSAVDVFIMPEERHTFSRASSSGENDRFHIPTTKVRYTPGSSSETVIHLVNQAESANLLSDEEIGAADKNCNKLLTSTVTSVSSQDSGINLSFHDQECSTNNFAKRRSSSESSASRHLRKESEKLKFSTLQRQNKSEIEKNMTDQDRACQIMKWICPPKNVWQPSLEALQDYDMIRDGDKVMVCLSGGKDSLCLLHTLLQYQNHVQNKGILFSLGAVTIDPDSSGCDYFKLMPHLKNLGVHYIVEDQSESQTDVGKLRSSKRNFCGFCTRDKRRRLYYAAKNYGYNVLAIGQHLDDFSESFLMSVFHGSNLATMKAHYYIREHDLRVIRPFAYVREKALRQFVVSYNLPAVLNSSSPETTKEHQRVKQVLAQQEILFPKLFTSLRVALKPLMSFKLDASKPSKGEIERNSEEIDTSDAETDEEPVRKDD